jgi:hypothetical protein
MPDAAREYRSDHRAIAGRRAWQSNDGGPREGVPTAAFEPAGFDAGAFATDSDVGSILYRFWAAVGAFRNFLESGFAILRLEFWCATHKETHDLWMKREYGLPDPCDPFPDLCTKVAAIGGARCEYFAEAGRARGARRLVDRVRRLRLADIGVASDPARPTALRPRHEQRVWRVVGNADPGRR